MLTIDATVPVSISESGSAPEASTTLQVLRALNLLTLGHRSELAEAQNPDAGHDIARLEAKIDMLIAMVGALVTDHSGLPAPRPVRFNAESLEVNLDRAFAIGARVVVALYPNPDLPRPLILPGTVDGACQRDDGSHDITLTYSVDNPQLRDEFERYVFLCHRQSLGRQAARSSQSSKI